ncbi:MAG: hypothetical protein PUC47_02700 [Oscillospiraceae bacterium]|nr:hypothetical protein [Oscillospiraceae bacterium]
MKKGNKITLGGMMVALSMVCMMLTGLLPMADYALPALAGILLIPIVVELGRKWAVICWLAVSLLSFILAPLKDSALFYFVLLGHYPILKSLIESWRKPALEWTVKFACFNLTVGAGLAAAVWLFRLDGYGDIFSAAPWLIAAGLLFLNLVFLVYDVALTRLVTAYMNYFRPRYVKKLLK